MLTLAEVDLVQQYWDTLQTGEPAAKVRLAKRVVRGEDPTSDAFHSATCVLFANKEVAFAKRELEKALLDDFEGCSAVLLPLLAHAYQRSYDVESAHRLFSTCESLGFLTGKNAWAAAEAREVAYALAEHTMHRALTAHGGDEDFDTLDANSVVARSLYEAHFRARSTEGGAVLSERQAVDRKRPDFIIAGSAKCGTTYLYDLICRSASVWNRRPKEIHYFTSMYRFGGEFYSRFFDGCPDGLKCGEASPDYFDACNSERPGGRLDTAKRIGRTRPDTKVIVVLRDPALRAVSLYNQLTSNDSSSAPIPGNRRLDTLTLNELARYNQGRVLISGRFINPLRRYVEVLGRERLLVVTFDELKDAKTIAARISDFLDIEPPAPTRLGELSTNAGAHGRPSADLYGALREYYADSLTDLDREFGIRL